MPTITIGHGSYFKTRAQKSNLLPFGNESRTFLLALIGPEDTIQSVSAVRAHKTNSKLPRIARGGTVRTFDGTNYAPKVAFAYSCPRTESDPLQRRVKARELDFDLTTSPITRNRVNSRAFPKAGPGTRVLSGKYSTINFPGSRTTYTIDFRLGQSELLQHQRCGCSGKESDPEKSQANIVALIFLSIFSQSTNQ